MAQDNCQKIKLLKLVEMLRQETDETHPMTTMVIVDRLNKMGISCERRTLSKDIALLNEQGFEVMICRVGKEKGYYVADRSFSLPELKILIDAVQAASFITEKKSQELISRIVNLGGSHSAELLKRNMVCFNTRKHSNESIYYNVDALEDALQHKKKVSFRYFDIGINKEKIYRKDKQHYNVEPVALVFNEDNYYLVAYSAKYDGTANYRVDRMDSVEVLEERVSERALGFKGDIAQYTEQAFKMYGGSLETVVLEFDYRLIGAVYDRFGESTDMIAFNDKAVATVNVQLSPTFWGWLFQFGSQMRIISPTSVIEEYNKKLEMLKNE
ncbi:MAG: WYL domain-containing protein [Ruminococcus sp.]|nr:WYL domain-containing protein [Ruminococcus sp.]